MWIYPALNAGPISASCLSSRPVIVLCTALSAIALTGRPEQMIVVVAVVVAVLVTVDPARCTVSTRPAQAVEPKLPNFRFSRPAINRFIAEIAWWLAGTTVNLQTQKRTLLTGRSFCILTKSSNYAKIIYSLKIKAVKRKKEDKNADIYPWFKRFAYGYNFVPK